MPSIPGRCTKESRRFWSRDGEGAQEIVDRKDAILSGLRVHPGGAVSQGSSCLATAGLSDLNPVGVQGSATVLGPRCGCVALHRGVMALEVVQEPFSNLTWPRSPAIPPSGLARRRPLSPSHQIPHHRTRHMNHNRQRDYSGSSRVSLDSFCSNASLTE
jgi:hypothetical protein